MLNGSRPNLQSRQPRMRRQTEVNPQMPRHDEAAGDIGREKQPPSLAVMEVELRHPRSQEGDARPGCPESARR